MGGAHEPQEPLVNDDDRDGTRHADLRGRALAAVQVRRLVRDRGPAGPRSVPDGGGGLHVTALGGDLRLLHGPHRPASPARHFERLPVARRGPSRLHETARDLRHGPRHPGRARLRGHSDLGLGDAMTLDSNVPGGPLADKWDRHKFESKLVNPANRRKYSVIIVGTGLAGASAASSLGELGYNVKS